MAKQEKAVKINLGKVLAGLGIVAVLLLILGFIGIMISSKKEVRKESIEETEPAVEDIRDLRQSRYR